MIRMISCGAMINVKVFAKVRATILILICIMKNWILKLGKTLIIVLYSLRTSLSSETHLLGYLEHCSLQACKRPEIKHGSNPYLRPFQDDFTIYHPHLTFIP